jgi:hypothetical protein
MWQAVEPQHAGLMRTESLAYSKLVDTAAPLIRSKSGAIWGGPCPVQNCLLCREPATELHSFRARSHSNPQTPRFMGRLAVCEKKYKIASLASVLVQ